MKKKPWYEYLWIASALYICLGFFNILFAWLGLICFFTPLAIAVLGGDKLYCNKYCGRGKLLNLIGGTLGLSVNGKPPAFLRSSWFRHGFLTFFMIMFFWMLYSTYRVFAGADLKEAVTLLWTFDMPWHWTDTSFAPAWVARFAFGFYGIMLTSMLLGLITMTLFRPRTWCVYCPMGAMTQGICRIKHRKEAD